MTDFPADNAHVRPLGRSFFANGTRYLGWSCSAVEFVFTGTEVSAKICTDWVLDEPWKEIFQPYLAVFINGESVPQKRFPINSGTSDYTIYKCDTPQTVTIRITKLSEAAFSQTGILSISADGEIRPTSPLPRRMEFIGDSITCGFGIEGKCAEENFRTATENPWINYAARTARAFGAEFNLISWSSIGVCSSWTDSGEINNSWLIPMAYDYTDIASEGMLKPDSHIEWNFAEYVPDVIILNLGTNDVSYTKDIPEKISEFKTAYAEFIRHIRDINRHAHIICALGMMGAELFPAINEMVEGLGDDKVYALEFDVQKPEDGIGCEKHPNEITHKKASEKLAKKISEITGWTPDHAAISG